MVKKKKRSELENLKRDKPIKDDKRLYCRFALENIPVRFKDLRVGEKSGGACRDIGGGGASIECSQEIKPRTPLEMWFDLPDGFEPMHLLGRVAWAKAIGASWKLGVNFDRPKWMSMTRILKLESTEI